jgi:hypothetical protein
VVCTSWPSGPTQFVLETPPLLAVRRLRWSRHLPRHSRLSDVLPPRPAAVRRAGTGGHRARGTAGSCSSWPPGIACARVVVICLWVWLSRILYGHAPSLTSPISPVEAEALPSHRVVLSRWSSVLWPPPTSHLASPWTSLLQLMPAVTMAVDHRPDETSPAEYRSLAVFRRLLSQHPAPHTPEGPSRLLPGSSPLPWPSLSLTSSAPSGSRCRANIPTLPCDVCIAIHFMLRAAVLLSFLRRILRFPGLTGRTGSTTGHPEALGACCVASWQLPRLVSHQLADDSDHWGTALRAHRRVVRPHYHGSNLPVLCMYASYSSPNSSSIICSSFGMRRARSTIETTRKATRNQFAVTRAMPVIKSIKDE